jgi:predicted DNA-binding WGR domain protein
MRRFVFVAGASAKFWEVSTEGSALSVHFGPLGSDGQTKTKDLGTETKAQAELEKLVKKKLAEGYGEEGDTPAAPERPRVGWTPQTRALLHPRRARRPNAPKVDVGKAWKSVTAAFDARTRSQVKAGLRHAAPEDRLLMNEAVRSFASKTPASDSSPRVEAVRAQLLSVHGHHVNTPPSLLKAHDNLVHVWCEVYGVPFAVEAMTETYRTALAAIGSLYIVRRPENFGRYGNQDLTPWHGLRAHLAAADEQTYAKARAVAEPVHDQGADVLFQAALSFVFEDEAGWLREAIAKCSYFIQGDRGSPAM